MDFFITTTKVSLKVKLRNWIILFSSYSILAALADLRIGNVVVITIQLILGVEDVYIYTRHLYSSISSDPYTCVTHMYGSELIPLLILGVEDVYIYTRHLYSSISSDPYTCVTHMYGSELIPLFRKPLNLSG